MAPGENPPPHLYLTLITLLQNYITGLESTFCVTAKCEYHRQQYLAALNAILLQAVKLKGA